MAWELAVAGTVSLDDVTTPAGRRRDQLGGSAVYFAIAAAPATVHLVGCVGADDEAVVVAALWASGAELGGLEVAAGPTRRWRARHDFERWVAVEERVVEGVYSSWRPRLTTAAAAAPILFLGSMSAEQQLSSQRQSSARLVTADTMTAHIGAEPDQVARVVEASDVLFVNRAELAALTRREDADWRGAAQALCGHGRLRAVVVKAGPLGAALVTPAAIVERDAVAAEPVVDPTGAGDSLAGGFLAACAAAERDDDAFLVSALDAGLRRAAAAVGAFGTTGLLPTPAR